MDNRLDFHQGLWSWYEFRQDARILYLTLNAEYEQGLPGMKCFPGAELQIIEPELLKTPDWAQLGVFHYVLVSAGVFEQSREPAMLLRQLYGSLSEDGVLLLAAENRLGIRYFCGDRDPYIGHSFDGIENYRKLTTKEMESFDGRLYSKNELHNLLKAAGFAKQRFYSVFPDLQMPQVIYAEDYLPQEKLDIRITPEYNNPNSVFLEEQTLYDSLAENGLFHAMANSYLVECPKDGIFAPVYHVTTSMDRGLNDVMATVIKRDNIVEKKALYPEGVERLQNLVANSTDLSQHGVHVLQGRIHNNVYQMPYCYGENGTTYFRRLLETDVDSFMRELKRFAQIVFCSSEVMPYEEVNWDEFDPDWRKRKKDDPNIERWKRAAFSEDSENLGPILRKGYLDLVCLNCFFQDGDFVFIDQEFWFPQIPAYAILYRTISLIYGGSAQYQGILPEMEVYKYFHMDEYLDLWRRFSTRFTDDLRHVEELRDYHRKRRTNPAVLNTNRQRMNYSQEEYDHIFRNIFDDMEGKKIYLFGSGLFTERFLVRFGDVIRVDGILDNNAKRWGEKMGGYPIMSPEVLLQEDVERVKVIICIKKYLPVVHQLTKMGICNYGIFDWNIDYKLLETYQACHMTEEAGDSSLSKDMEPVERKKYPVGYIAGVFDLFHVGHLNLLQRAKEQCDYLIVGVVSDEQVMESKGTHPMISCEDRMRIVEACRYVDQVVKLPLHHSDTEEMYLKYHFDVQFSGSDYENDPAWLAKREFLRKHGAELIFFPYTESTSSTKLKDMIHRSLQE